MKTNNEVKAWSIIIGICVISYIVGILLPIEKLEQNNMFTTILSDLFIGGIVAGIVTSFLLLVISIKNQIKEHYDYKEWVIEREQRDREMEEEMNEILREEREEVEAYRMNKWGQFNENN